MPPTALINRLLNSMQRQALPMLIAVGITLSSSLASAQTTPTIESHLASAFVDDARDMLRAPQLTGELLDGARVLLERASELDPDNSNVWLLLGKVATLLEDRDLQIAATDQLLKLEPQNDVARLIRITQMAEEYQTVEDRVDFLESLVRRAQDGTLEATTGSRLAMDCALLHRRAGNTDAFASMLAIAVDLDPANRRAAALAAGYFRANIDDPLAEAELFCGLLLADPTDLRVADELAAIVLEHGAYEGAERILSMVVGARRATGLAPPDDLLADWALAAWGRGDPEMALRIIQTRQQERNELIRNLMRKNDSELTIEDAAEITGPLSPSLEAVRLAIHERLRPDFVAESLQSLIDVYRDNIQRMEAERANPATQNP